MPEEVLKKEDLEKGLQDLKKSYQDEVKELQKNVLEKSEAGVKAANDRIAEIEKAKGELEAQFNALEVKMKELKAPEAKQEHFNDVLKKTLEENAAQLKGFARGNRMTLEMKAVGDMSTANFSGTTYANLTTNYLQAPLPLLTERIWMRNILPSGTTNSATIVYPRHTGGEGGVAPWKQSDGAKPEVDFDFDNQTVNVEWLAGYVKVPRQMLDDVAWLNSFLQQNLLLSLYKAENNQILNGNGTSPQLKGIIPQAQAYDGDYTIGIERIIDAGYGQVNGAYGNANLALLNPRDAVAIILNKASGSGEYDLPPGTVGFVNNQLRVAGITIVQTNEMTAGNFLIGDNTASQFITRLAPELRVFEQNEDDAKKNLIMIRIEERAALATYYPEWWVKGTLAATT